MVPSLDTGVNVKCFTLQDSGIVNSLLSPVDDFLEIVEECPPME